MRLRWVALALVAGCAAACTSSGDDPTPTPTPTSSSGTSLTPTSPKSTSPTSTTPTTPSFPTTGFNVRPGERPPVLPNVTMTNSAAGAHAFADFWFRALDWGYATTSSALPRMLYAPICSDCAKFMKDYDEPRAAHQHFVGGRLMITRSVAAPGDHRFGAQYAYDITVKADTLSVVDASGKTVDGSPAISRAPFRIWVEWTNGRYRIVGYKRIVNS